MTDCQGRWMHRATIEDGAHRIDVHKCSGCPNWWVIFGGRGGQWSEIVISATTAEDAVRQAMTERMVAERAGERLA